MAKKKHLSAGGRQPEARLPKKWQQRYDLLTGQTYDLVGPFYVNAWVHPPDKPFRPEPEQVWLVCQKTTLTGPGERYFVWAECGSADAAGLIVDALNRFLEESTHG